MVVVHRRTEPHILLRHHEIKHRIGADLQQAVFRERHGPGIVLHTMSASGEETPVRLFDWA